MGRADGAAINLLKGGAGGLVTLTGSVAYGIEADDARSRVLVAAAVRKLTPGAFDIGAMLGTIKTARRGQGCGRPCCVLDWIPCNGGDPKAPLSR